MFDAYAKASGTVTVQEELADTIMGEILPGLRETLAKLQALRETWLINGVDGLILASAQSGDPLAGFDAKTWVAWGMAFNKTLEFLDTPVDELDGKTTRQVLLTRYTKYVK